MNVNTIFQIGTIIVTSIDLVSDSFFAIVSPVQKVACYTFPFLETFFQSKVDPKDEYDHESLVKKRKYTNLVKKLCKDHGINKSINIYHKKYNSFSSVGGRLSISSPIIYVPSEQLFPKEELSLKQTKNLLDENEIEYQLTRQVVHLKNNTDLVKTITKIGISLIAISALVFFSLSSGYLLLVTAGVIGVNHLANKYFQNLELKVDKEAVDSLSKKLSHSKAVTVAISSFEKLKEENKIKRQRAFLGKLQYTTDGVERFNFSSPSNKKRLSHLQNMKALYYPILHNLGYSISSIANLKLKAG